MVDVEIVTVGNEILLGVVQDANSNYLCRVVRGMGGRVRHIVVVGDDAEAISEEIRASVSRGTGLILTCGGLGPTGDDVTLEAVAGATSVGLELNELARELVEKRYRSLVAAGSLQVETITEARLKMAWMPAHATAIENPVGVAPASLVAAGRARIISLPGVPAELKAVVEGPLQRFLREILGSGVYMERQLLVECNDESLLAPLLRRVADSNPSVYVKSRAAAFGPEVDFRILLSVTGDSAEITEKLLNRAIEDIRNELDREGLSCKPYD